MNIHRHLHPLDFGVVAIYLLLLLGIGTYISFRKKKSNEKDYFLAGSSLRWYSIGLTMWGTNVGPSMLIASCAVGYTTGIVAGNFSWYAFIFIGLLALVFAPHYKNTGVSTLPEFMGKRFNKTTRELLAWYSLVTILISWLGLTLYAGGLLVSQIMAWPLWASVSALMLLATFFAVAGGLEAIAITNVFQMILLIVASSVLVIAGLHELGGVDRLLTELPTDYGRLFLPADNPDYPWGGHCAGLSRARHLVLVHRPEHGAVGAGGQEPGAGTARYQPDRLAQDHRRAAVYPAGHHRLPTLSQIGRRKRGLHDAGDRFAASGSGGAHYGSAHCGADQYH